MSARARGRGRGELFALEFADELDAEDAAAINDLMGPDFLDPAWEPWLTRFHTWYMPELYPDDAWFRADATNVPYHAEIDVSAPESYAARVRWSAGGAFALAALLLAWRRLGADRGMV